MGTSMYFSLNRLFILPIFIFLSISSDFTLKSIVGEANINHIQLQSTTEIIISLSKSESTSESRSKFHTKQLHIQSDQGFELVKWSPDSKYLAMTDTDRSTVVFDVKSENEEIRLSHSAPVELSEWSPDSRYLAISNLDDIIEVFDISTGQQIININHGGIIDELLWSANGQYLAILATQPDDPNGLSDVV
ncbi:MAG: hypothetical protein AAGG51_03100 [Cyanobacteria bacterium P01_G01_bin.54]